MKTKSPKGSKIMVIKSYSTIFLENAYKLGVIVKITMSNPLARVKKFFINYALL